MLPGLLWNRSEKFPSRPTEQLCGPSQTPMWTPGQASIPGNTCHLGLGRTEKSTHNCKGWGLKILSLAEIRLPPGGRIPSGGRRRGRKRRRPGDLGQSPEAAPSRSGSPGSPSIRGRRGDKQREPSLSREGRSPAPSMTGQGPKLLHPGLGVHKAARSRHGRTSTALKAPEACPAAVKVPALPAHSGSTKT